MAEKYAMNKVAPVVDTGSWPSREELLEIFTAHQDEGLEAGVGKLNALAEKAGAPPASPVHEGDAALKKESRMDLLASASKMDLEVQKEGAADHICRLLGSHPLNGLEKHPPSDKDVRIEMFGGNFFDEKPLPTYCSLVWEACQDNIIIALIIMATLSFIVELVWGHDSPFCTGDEPASWCPDDHGATTLTLCGDGSLLGDAHDHDHRALAGDEGPKMWTGWIESCAIYLSVIIITNVCASTDYNKARMFQELTRKLDKTNKKVVLRGGQVVELPDAEIVVGDVVQFNAHNSSSLPADGFLLNGSGVKADESSLTGEPEPMSKSVEEDPFLFSGTSIVSGAGKMIVTAVGPFSVQGKIKMAVYGEDENDEQSPLFKKLDVVAIKIGKYGTIICVACFIFMCIRAYAPTPPEGTTRDPSRIIPFIITAITILAVAVPEGLPLAVNLSLAFSSQQMSKLSNLVKTLESCETMGSATTICTDKTGTLTANRMTVRGAAMGTLKCNASAGETIGKTLLGQGIAKVVIDLLASCIAVCTMSESVVTTVAGRDEFKGNPTECALLVLCRDLGFEYQKIRDSTVGRSEGTEDSGRPRIFTSARKMMSWAVPKPSSEGGGYRVYAKGASEIILSRCTSYVTTAGETQALTAEESKRLETEVISPFADDAMRTIGLAYRDMPADADLDALSDTIMNSDGSPAFLSETELTQLGIVAIEDPLRDEVPGAIAKCYNAGIDVRMVTGDNLQTAIAIAKRANILTDELHYEDGSDGKRVLKKYRAMEGSVFRKMVHDKPADGGDPKFNQASFDEIWPYLRVLARSSPEDKFTIANGLNRSMLFEDAAKVAKLKEEGITIFDDRQVVAMTGDGTNDAPALKRADVGFAMGISGTQIAKDAADIILLDDNFASIVVAAEWGRNVYDSISKFLQFQLTVNIVAVTTATIGSIVSAESPIAAVQMLWVNLIMDSLASLALATEPPDDSLLQRMPVKRNAFIVSGKMWFNMLGHSLYQLIVVMLMLYEPYMVNCTMDPDTMTAFPDCDTTRSGFLPVSGRYGSCMIHGTDWYLNSVAIVGTKQPSEHYTLMFGVFVSMQLFNEINARKVHGEINVFKGLGANPYFLSIWFFTWIIQVIMVSVGGKAIRCAPYGLTGEQWAWCLVIGAFELVWQQLINLVYRLTHKNEKE